MKHPFPAPEEIRQDLHRIPEPAFQEHQTKAYILDCLEGLEGLQIHTFTNSTGILVEYSQGVGSYLLFRADMDALPVTEATGCSFTSTHPGLMHACGHDVHMAILLGLIKQVTDEYIKMNLLFLFQPAEEGQGGAESVLAEGLLQGFEIRHAFALHVSGNLPVGSISTRPGIFFAIPQEFDVSFTGQAAHAAFPAKGRNALVGGLEFCRRVEAQILELQKTQQVIYNIGVFKAGTIRNIIPGQCLLQGTHRTLSKELREQINNITRQTASAVAAEYNLISSVELLCTYDPVVNDTRLYEELKQACLKTGLEFIESGVQMTGEDFGFFTSLYPGLLFWLGGGQQTYDLHSDKFLPDAACIPVGINLMIRLMELNQNL